ncbi:GRIP and coiled-coil domain-containing protein 2-like [Euwallacea similis]|uniref:GRIP and coiled-coil domain-containing protein 2-like n=1 Tax=Euwallacea similis TaxID=1736056 RepID=UPI00344EC88C
MESQESKKVNLEDLSREELLKKCKNLIALAQKAKISKESLQEENNNLREQLDKQLTNDATTELIDTLTNEKLSLVTQIEDLKLKNKHSEISYNSLLDRIQLLETENTSYHRQLKRLEDENEQLLSDMSTLEFQISELRKLDIKQKEELLELEKSNGDAVKDLQKKIAVSLEEVRKLNGNLKMKENEVLELSQELQAEKIISSSNKNEGNKNCDSHVKEINELKLKNDNFNQQLKDVENINDKLKDKVALYHSKLKKFILMSKEIKQEKNQVLQIFKAYTEQIKDWKEQLLTASQHLIMIVRDLQKENKSLKNETKIQIDLFEAENRKLKENLKTQNNIDALTESHKTEIDNLNISLNEYVRELALKTSIIEEATESIKVLEESKKLSETFQKQLVERNRELEQTSAALILSRKEVYTLNEALKRSMDTERRLADQSGEEILRLAQANKILEEKVTILKEELESVQKRIQVDNCTRIAEEGVPSTTPENDVNLKRENSELLLEMNQMNQALKERGEIISQLEAHCEEIKKKLQVYESQANRNVDSISEKEETIRALQSELQTLKQQSNIHNDSSKDIEIANLKIEITNLKEASHETSYAESENMSTSTISRSEEASRLKDLEGSWEERYGKLRTLAIKLKAKIRDQVNIIGQSEKEKEDLMKKQSHNVKTIQSLQNQMDELQDTLDQVKTENKQYLSKLNSVAETISKDKQLLVENEETISNLKKEIDVLSTEKQTVENWKKEVGAKVKTLRKELEAKNVLLKDAEGKILRLEEEIEKKAGQLKIEEESHKQTKNLLEQSSTESKRNSVLNLEMQDYERSVKELTLKIEKQNSEIGNLQTQLDLQKNTTNALREQNKTLEERIEEEEKLGNSTNQEINAYKKTISNLEDIVQQKEIKILDVTKLLETVRSENEELSTELSKVIAEHQKSLNLLKSERDQLRNQLSSTQQHLRDAQDVLKLREDELGAIKGDYETYKVRAQSVLKKSQNRDLGLEEKLSEELSSCREEIVKLREELKHVSEKLENQEINNKKLTFEKDRLTKLSLELETEVDELKIYNEQLSVKHQKALNEQAETIRNLKVHAETLSQCYRQQLSEQEVRHNREIIELQSRIEKTPSPETIPVHPNMPREEGEGSESIESNPALNNVHPIPLERLLDSKSDDEVVHLKKSLLEQESKVIHLTALLSDTEQDLAKHVQMNKVLKEEIRRQQRSVEREQHAENLEYMKNVVIKFVTLSSGDERTRLVPVLNTILKLSPEETQKLAMIAKGEPGLKAWANYLPLWSPNKPQ